MKNIQVGDIVRIKNDPHRYVVWGYCHGDMYKIRSTVDARFDVSFADELELVEGIERVQRGDEVLTDGYGYGACKVVEVGFNSLAIKRNDFDTVAWFTFQEAKDWKIVGKEVEERIKLKWRGEPTVVDDREHEVHRSTYPSWDNEEEEPAEVEEECEACKAWEYETGYGKVCDCRNEEEEPEEHTIVEGRPCPFCDGTGKIQNRNVPC